MTTYNVSDALRFDNGKIIIINFAPWYKRLWRYLTLYKEPSMVITKIDRATGVITVESEVLTTERGDRLQ